MERVLISALLFSLIFIPIFLVKCSVIKDAGKIYLKGFSITGKEELIIFILNIILLILLCLASVFLLEYYEFFTFIVLIFFFIALTPYNYYLGEEGIVKNKEFYAAPLNVKFFHKAEIKEVKKEIKDNKIILKILMEKEKGKNREILISIDKRKEKILDEWMEKIK